MKSLIIKAALLASLLLPSKAIASTRSISTSDAQGLNGKTIELPIHQGNGLTIDFVLLNELIVNVLIDDPSRFTFTGTDGKLCPSFIKIQCQSTGSSGIRITQIDQIDFPNITSSADGSTTLTVLTTNPQGVKKYNKFILIPKGKNSRSSFSHLKVKPDSDKKPLSLPSRQPKKI